eukprot:CAMPEP_0170635816 /NCGR_PEP_ID=MMETSP0224-20130122/37433_1 /TAXON_ID=285029 /ORGANISM="Togula jolla, Strain CCCM 725" /LENGTH=54 /DNA_ID=CAMNT_0010965361 /DNA_START=449 /DNA_END=613 /DNA_ORIENTATION=+
MQILGVAPTTRVELGGLLAELFPQSTRNSKVASPRMSTEPSYSLIPNFESRWRT